MRSFAPLDSRGRLSPRDHTFPTWDSLELNHLNWFIPLLHSNYNLDAGFVPDSRCAVATMPKTFYRRQLPHLQRDYKPHFLTFCSAYRWILPPQVRDFVLNCCKHDDGTKLDLHVVAVMPDHVHMIFVPLVNEQAREVYSLAEITDAIKGASAHKINRSPKSQRTSLAARIV